MRVVVFGGAGFLGSHVADALTAAGHEVVIFDLKASPYLQVNQRQVVGSILDLDQVSQALQGCDLVYNFAGLSDIEEANARPLDTVRANILGNAIVLEASHRANVRRFVFASSLYVYSGGGGFYRSSKQACELLVENYREAYQLPYTILRYGSLYGERADARNWVRGVLHQALKDGRIVRYGDGEEVREYIHVRDAARFSVAALDSEYENQTVVISGLQAIKIKDLLKMVQEIMGGRVQIEYRSPQDQRLPGAAQLHYSITPYSFSPKIARKLVGKDYLDLGQGLLELLEQIHRDLPPAGAITSRS